MKYSLRIVMKHRGVGVFAVIEILIGAITFAAVTLSLIQGKSAKPPEVIIFVLVTALISFGIGIGILTYNIHCYHLLLYFSSVIILSKILVFAKIISFAGALETSIPSSLKNTVSILYHSLLIYYFSHKSVRLYFKKSLA